MLNIEQLIENKIKAELSREVKAYINSITSHPFYPHLESAVLSEGQTIGDFFNMKADTKNKANVLMMQGALPGLVAQQSKIMEDKLVKILLDIK